MTQTVVQSVNGAWAGSGTTLDLVINGVAAGNALEVRVAMYFGGTLAQSSPSVLAGGALTWQLGARAQSSTGSGVCAEIHYAENAGGGNYTIRVTTTSASGSRYGWVQVLEIAGRATSSSIDSAATGSNNGSSATPSVAGAGSTTEANTMIVAVMAADGSSSNLGIDAIAGNSLSWNNRLIKQDPNTEMGGSFDDAAATATLTPSVNWGTMSSSPKWAAVVCAFKDADGGGGTTYDETISEGVTAGESSAVGVTANASLTETATAGETSAALVTAEASLTETATVGESSEVAATINDGTSEGVTPGDSYVSDPVTYDETISEGVTLGDSYATDGPAVSSGGSRRRPRREPQWDSEPIRPEQMPPYEASILVRQPSQIFSLGVEVSTAVDVEFEQDAGLMELAAESGDEVAIEMQAAAQFVDALLATVPMRKAQAPTFAKLAPMLVRIEIEQAEQIEYEIA